MEATLGQVCSPAAARLFLVCPSTGGLWIARDALGLVEGLFRSRKDAVRFALVEGGHDNVVCFSSDPEVPSFIAAPS
jgi:hypothetical protein